MRPGRDEITSIRHDSRPPAAEALVILAAFPGSAIRRLPRTRTQSHQP